MLNPRTPQAVYDEKKQGACFGGVFGGSVPLDEKIERVDERWRREVRLVLRSHCNFHSHRKGGV